MRAYLATFRARFRTVMGYRAAALAGVFTQLFFGFILVHILESWYASGAGAPIGLAQTASYVWLGQAFLAFQVWGPDPELRDLIRSGEVARDLLRPSDLFGLWFARTLGWKAAGVALRFWVVLAFAALVLPALGMPELALNAPASPAGFAAFLAMMALATLTSAGLAVLVSCFQFSQVSAAGASAIAGAASMFFSGLIVPLPLLSGPVERLSALLPFRGLADLPFRFWLGTLPPRAVFSQAAYQAGWVLALIAGGWLYTRSRLGRIAVAGG